MQHWAEMGLIVVSIYRTFSNCYFQLVYKFPRLLGQVDQFGTPLFDVTIGIINYKQVEES